VKVRDARYTVLRNFNRHLGNLRVRCYRCGDFGHVAAVCRNALTCFKCGRLGHKSEVCRSITLLPSSSSPSKHISSTSFPSLVPHSHSPSAMASRSRVLRFLENDLSAKTKEYLFIGVILKAKGFLRVIF
jgi:Zinc knuckle